MLRFSTSVLLLGLVACGDDGGTGGTGGTTSTNASSGSGKASSSGTGTSGSSVSGSGSSGSGSGSSGSGSGSTTATGTGASSSSTGDNLQFCGVDDPGGTEERCDPVTQFCAEMNGGIVASQQFTCSPVPAGCNGAPSCDCVPHDGCICSLDGAMVHVTCNVK